MNVKVYLKLPSGNKLAVPKEAVTLRSDRPVVFTLKNGAAHWNYVKTGFENNSSIVIEEGISNGDTVIFKGNVHLAHGSEVQIVQ
jgi:membrane fusion protein, multidrug efflux system